MGILISQYKDPYKPTSIIWKGSEFFFFVAQITLQIIGAPPCLCRGSNGKTTPNTPTDAQHLALGLVSLGFFSKKFFASEEFSLGVSGT